MKQRVDFAEENNPWSSYVADDGTRFRIRTILVAVYRTDNKLPDGQFAHEFNCQQVIEQVAPEPKITPAKGNIT